MVGLGSIKNLSKIKVPKLQKFEVFQGTHKVGEVFARTKKEASKRFFGGK